MTNVNELDCFRARRALWPPERLRVADDAVLEAQKHVDGCECCQNYFAQDPVLLEAYELLRSESAPAAVREKVFDVLAHERSHRIGATGTSKIAEPRSRIRKAAFWTLMVGTAAIGGFMASALGPVDAILDRSMPEDGSVFMDDYVRRAVSQDRIASSDPSEVSNFLMKELGISQTAWRLAGLDGTGMKLSGAEVCYLNGRRGAMVIYEGEGRSLSHYLIPMEDDSAREPASSDPLSVEEGSEAAPAVVTWASQSLEQALIGSFSVDQLIHFVQASQP